jgi:hypothetical protein
MYKLRTMRTDAEVRTGPVWAKDHDPRCTHLGRWLRAVHLDELPQLLNVLMGHMAMVGPRPERPEFVELLETQLPGYVERLCVRPGITGLAQIMLPPDHTIDDVRRKLIVDLYYMRNLSMGLDLRLLCFTGLRLLRVPVAWCNRVAPMPKPQHIPGLVPTFQGRTDVPIPAARAAASAASGDEDAAAPTGPPAARLASSRRFLVPDEATAADGTTAPATPEAAV